MSANSNARSRLPIGKQVSPLGEPANKQFNYGVTMDRLALSRSWTPWLLIRYCETDAGQRPIPGSDGYASTDIWVESSDPGGNAVPGEPNFVNVRILNLGKAPALPMRVDFYWGNPAIGMGPGQMTLIGTEWIHQFLAHSLKEVRCSTPWIPVYENGGHECLIVNCSSPVLDPIAQPFQTTLDRHVGQRNITVLEGAPGQTVNFTLGVNNIFPVATQVAIKARVEQIAVAPSLLAVTTLRQVVSQAAVLSTVQAASPEVVDGFHLSPSSGRLSSLLSKPVRAVPVKGAYAYLGQRLLDADRNVVIGHPMKNHNKRGTRSGRRDRNQVLHDTEMEAFEQRLLEIRLRVPSDSRSGTFIVVHLAQDGLGLSMGGYTIVVQVSLPKTPSKR